ncbi:amino acid ABC transporter substrate-binding protein [Aminobacter carboxidus]|uniref:Amino acid ABC transporter substrate-binding protein n=1 Tax=Aminobacter carboxidus TaxID=376165 RepID=A0A8E1WH04_9HYPH|nr:MULTISPECIES: amino acid ABC transporter substrate-binding protein [Aminobacter carboxidus group]MBB6468362.1 general L-amino acid transport system substrate-binding protein [Aminobacter lissarensis]MBE1207939.1 amino acid ABC transporter substrate-binding protein [Aminobacter carboxidus]
MNNLLNNGLAAAMLLAAAAGASAPAQAGATIDAIRQRGEVVCGVSTGIGGFSIADSSGQWTGLTTDFCRAVSAAVLGDAAKEKFVPLSPQQRFTALQSGEVDMLTTVATWTLTRDASLGLLYAGVYFYDGQGFLVPKSLDLKGALDLDGASICTATGTTSELNLADYFRANGKKFTPVVFESQNEARAAFFSGRCQAFSADMSYLSSVRASDAPNPDEWVILPEMISKEPLGPVVGRNDLEWYTVAKWTLMALIEAEEKGITQANVDQMKDSQDPTIQRLLGTSGDMGEKLGLDAGWAYRAIKRGGNYGEIFERNVGPKTPLRMERNANALWTQGGQMYALPVR